MKNRINQLLDEISKLAASNQEELEALRIKFLPCSMTSGM